MCVSIVQIDVDQHLPVGLDVLRSNDQVRMVNHNMHPLMHSSEVSGYYTLPPGRYLVLVYANKPTDEKKFALVVTAQTPSNIRLTKS